MARRIEITVSDEVWVRLDRERGHEPRASFVKRALEKALAAQTKAPELSEPTGASPSSAPSRAPEKAASVAAAPVPAFRCPERTCDRRFGSAAATCPLHGRKAVPV